MLGLEGRVGLTGGVGGVGVVDVANVANAVIGTNDANDDSVTVALKNIVSCLFAFCKIFFLLEHFFYLVCL